MADPEHDERQVERGGAARERDGVLDAGLGCELALERVVLRPERRDPVRRDRLGHELALTVAEVGRREVEARHGVEPRPRPRAPVLTNRSSRRLP